MQDPHGFDDFYRATVAGVLRFAYAVTGDRHEAQDIVQEAFGRAWRRWRTVREHPAPDAWVRVVVANLANDRWRRVRGLRVALARSGMAGPVAPPSEDTVLLVNALRQLPAKQRQAMALHYLFDFTVDDIARETGAASGTVKSWLSRGRTQLAKHLRDLGPARETPSDNAEVIDVA
ncbi:MAG TPA: SigE family RNA polymerase sigma factor [Micromonosporaceae bacterium]